MRRYIVLILLILLLTPVVYTAASDEESDYIEDIGTVITPRGDHYDVEIYVRAITDIPRTADYIAYCFLGGEKIEKSLELDGRIGTATFSYTGLPPGTYSGYVALLKVYHYPYEEKSEVDRKTFSFTLAPLGGTEKTVTETVTKTVTEAATSTITAVSTITDTETVERTSTTTVTKSATLTTTQTVVREAYGGLIGGSVLGFVVGAALASAIFILRRPRKGAAEEPN